MAQLTLVVAFLAGLVSFLSPCVLPIIPAFLVYLSGVSLNAAETQKKAIFFNSFFFVMGFSLVFALLGIVLNTILEKVAYEVQVWLARIGGTIIIIFGLYLTGLIKLPFLEREHKLKVKTHVKSRYRTSFLFGAAFAAGWTPCVGAVLGGILGLALSQPGSAFGLLFTYSLGLGLPFLLVGLFTAQATSWIHNYAHLLKYLNIIFGIFLVIIGVLAFTQNLSLIANFDVLNRWLLRP